MHQQFFHPLKMHGIIATVYSSLKKFLPIQIKITMHVSKSVLFLPTELIKGTFPNLKKNQTKLFTLFIFNAPKLRKIIWIDNIFDNEIGSYVLHNRNVRASAISHKSNKSCFLLFQKGMPLVFRICLRSAHCKSW